MTLKLLIADDHLIVREGLHSLISRQPDMEVVGEAGDGQTTIELARKLSPDVVVMDVTMPKLDGIDAARQIRKDRPQTKIVALSMHSARPFVYAMLRAGATAYLIKESAFDELIRAIRTVMANQMYLSPQISGTLVGDFVNNGPEAGQPPSSILSARELEVLQLLAEGRSTKEIAGHLRVSVKTIETHRRQLMKKLDINNLAELVKFAVREGLTTL